MIVALVVLLLSLIETQGDTEIRYQLVPPTVEETYCGDRVGKPGVRCCFIMLAGNGMFGCSDWEEQKRDIEIMSPIYLLPDQEYLKQLENNFGHEPKKKDI